jgi:predicted Fe-Mo cluster-binding NifX family protein
MDMKIAIPASDNQVDALIDNRFARCSYFCFYDQETNKTQFIENGMKNDAGGAGPQVSEYLINAGVKKVCVVEVGPKAMNILNKFNVEVILVQNGQTVQEIINSLNR